MIISAALTSCGSIYQPNPPVKTKTAQATLPGPRVHTEMPMTLATEVLREWIPTYTPSPPQTAASDESQGQDIKAQSTSVDHPSTRSHAIGELADPLTGTDPGVSLIDEHFSGSDGWDQFDNEYARGAIENGHYSLTVKRENLWSWVLHGPRGASFYYQGTITVADCRHGDNYGLLFRAKSDGSFILFSVACDGKYRLVRAIKGSFEAIIPWTDSTNVNKHNYVQVSGTEDGLTIREAPSLHAKVIHFAKDYEVFRLVDGPQYADGLTWWLLDDRNDQSRSGWGASSYLRETRTNVLGVRAEGDLFKLYLNGEYLTSATDETFTGGKFGVFAYSQSTPGLQVAFDDLVVFPVLGNGVPLASSPSPDYQRKP